MSSKWLVPVLAWVVAFSLIACGGGDGKTDIWGDDGPGDVLDVDNPEDPGQDAEPPLDPGQDPGGEDPGPTDPGRPDMGNETTDPGVEDPGEDPGTEDPGVEDPGTTDVPEPFCPCVVDEFWYCGTDGEDYQGTRCAQCAICAPSATCVGCTGNVACDETDDFILRKGKCAECADCDIEDECDRLSFTACGEVCALVGGVEGTFADLCALKTAAGCYDGYDELIVAFAECPRPTCEPCLGQAYNPVCGSNGKTYWNNCELNNALTCFGDSGVTRTCLGACTADKCPACPSTCSPVCGDDGITYMNACAATTCGTKAKEVDYNGRCCPECDSLPTNEVCTTAGNLYRNSCYATCHGESLCPTTVDAVCGADGQTYDNECIADCRAGGILHGGECTRLCEQCTTPLSPLCASTPQGTLRSYQNACFLDCLGGEGGIAGLCATGCQDICGSLASPKPWTPAGEVCGDDGFTYPSACFPEKCFGNIGYTAGACPVL